MTPQERELITELFDRLSSLESAQRDPQAEGAIADGMSRAPHAVYALVQTVLVQDEALKRANARIQELEGSDGGGAAPREGGSFRLPPLRTEVKPVSLTRDETLVYHRPRLRVSARLVIDSLIFYQR